MWGREQDAVSGELQEAFCGQAWLGDGRSRVQPGRRGKIRRGSGGAKGELRYEELQLAASAVSRHAWGGGDEASPLSPQPTRT